MNMNNGFTRGARPIVSKEVTAHYNNTHKSVTLEDYAKIWRDWINYSNDKHIFGLEEFPHACFTQGTTQTFDHFALKYGEIKHFKGEFQYHDCIGKFKGDQPVVNAFVHSVPFSDLGVIHPDLGKILISMELSDTPVCLDFAYWGIAKGIEIDLRGLDYIREITFSLSKPFHTLETHRVGIRFSRDYIDDGITMQNEVGMINKHSMALGASYMKKFGVDWNWNTYHDKYYDIIGSNELNATDTVIFATSSDEKYNEFNRGIPENNRICISKVLSDE